MSTIDPPQQRYQGVQKNSIAYRLMKSMGWNEGEGLGASKQGIKEHIRVKKKFENWGVGAVEAAERARDWSTGMIEFHRVLSTLSEVTSHHAGKGDSSDGDDEKSDASDGEMVVKKKEKKKDSKKKKDKRKANSDKKKTKKKRKNKSSSSSSDGDDDDDDDRSDNDDNNTNDDTTTTTTNDKPQRVKQATHLGRFKKRESAKMVKHYSSQDLAAILGGDPFAQMTVAAVENDNNNTKDDSDSSDNSDSDDGDGDIQEKKRMKSSIDDKSTTTITKKKKVVVISEDNNTTDKEQDNADNNNNNNTINTTNTTTEKEVWWSSYFVKSGKMGSLKKESTSKKKGFSEQDQTNLYNLAHDKATQGKVGLGRSSMPKKVAGARWAGKKTKLGSDSEDEDDNDDMDDDGSDDDDENNEGVVIVMPKTATQTGNNNNNDDVLKKIKWKKVAVQIFKGKGVDSMKIKSLSKAVMEEHGLDKQHKDVVMERIEEVVVSSSSFVVDGKVVKFVK